MRMIYIFLGKHISIVVVYLNYMAVYTAPIYTYKFIWMCIQILAVYRHL